jgi:phosphoribosylformylglycinamidine synthase
MMKQGKVLSCYTPTYGGVAEAVLKMAIGNNIGFVYQENVSAEDIFGYRYGAFVMEVAEGDEVGRKDYLRAGVCGDDRRQ